MITIGCSIEEWNETSQLNESTFSLLEILSDDAITTSKRPLPAIWAVCYKVYKGIVIPANFNPESDPFDELYGGVKFADGFPLISDSKTR